MHRLRLTLLLVFAMAAPAARAEIELSFVYDAPALTSGNLSGTVGFSVDIDGAGAATGSATSGNGSVSGDWTVTGSVGAGFETSFDVTLTATANISTRSTDGIGIQGTNPGRIDNPSEALFIEFDASSLGGYAIELTSIGYGNVEVDGAINPAMVLTDFAGDATTFPDLQAGGVFTVPVTAPGATFLGGGVGDLALRVADDPSTSTALGYALSSLSFDIIALGSLDLEVDRATGEAMLSNNSGGPLDVVGLSILSESGSLDPSDWNSITETYDGGGGDGGDGSLDSDDTWLLLEKTSRELAEATLGTTTLAEGQSVDLGAIFEIGGAEDLVAEFADAGTLQARSLEVSYVGVAPADLLAGDFNDDGVVDAADYTVWRENLGQSVGLPNETVSNGRVTQEDYDTWLANYGATLADSTSVPEPTSALLVGAICLVPLARRRG